MAANKYRISDPVLKHKAPSDLTQIFEWLKTNGVKKVVRISVLDYGDCPHPDSVIEKALASLDVEIWEWKKVDLCSDVIANSSKVVRQISLYLSGNPAVLMGWGSAQSFANRTKFPNVSSLVGSTATLCSPVVQLETIDLFVKEVIMPSNTGIFAS